MSRVHIYRVLFCSMALALSTSAFAQSASMETAKGSAPGVRTKMGEIELRAKVVELDLVHRTATLRNVKGELVILDIPPEVKNFDEVKVGDDVFLRYAAAVVVSLEPTSKSGIRERVESSASATGTPGNMPGVAAQRTVQVLAIVQSIDKKARKATLRGAKRTVTIDVPDSIDLKKLKVGDEVRATLVESAVLSVERAPAAAK